MSGEFFTIAGRSLQFIGWAFLPLLLWPAFLLLSGRGRSLSHGIIHTVETLMAFIGESVKWVMPIMVISVVLSVFALSIYGVSAAWWDESAIYLHAIGICLGVAPTYLAGQHVRVDIIYENMTLKARALVEFCGFYMLLMPVCLVAIWRSQSFISFSWQTLEGSSTGNGIKGVYILKTALFVMFLLLILQGLSMALRAALSLRQEKQISPPEGLSEIPFLEGADTAAKSSLDSSAMGIQS